MYRDIGLIPGTHYIGYDGTPEGLRNSLNEWIERDDLEQVAEAGRTFVAEHFNEEALLDYFIKTLKTRHEIWRTRRDSNA